MNLITTYRCPSCAKSFKPESQMPLRLRCPLCQQRWFLEVRGDRLLIAYSVAYWTAMGASYLFNELPIQFPGAIFIVLFVGLFFTAYRLVDADAVRTSQARARRSPISWLGLGFLVACFACTLVNYFTPVDFWIMIFVQLYFLPPAFSLLAFRLATYFPSRKAAYALVAVAVSGMVVVGFLPVGTFAQIMTRFLLFLVMMGALASAMTVREKL